MSTKIVAVSFKDQYGKYTQKQYHYLHEGEAKVDDFAVVDSPTDGFVVVQIKDVGLAEESPLGKATKYLVAVFDLEAYKIQRAKEQRKKEVEALLEGRLKTMDKQLRLQMLADIDPVAAKLLTELKNY